MRVELDLRKSVEKNAEVYFEKAKKAKKKVVGAREIVKKFEKKLEDLKKRKTVEEKKEKEVKVKKIRKLEWYERFRWFFTSEGFLVVGGRDATSNEIVIKKHTDKDDLVFHTDMAGSPFFVLKTNGKKPGKKSILEVGDAVCSYSRAWKLGLAVQQVFYVKPEQVTKEALSGEYLAKGSFMIKGKTNYIDNKINCAIGMMKDGRIMAGPLEAVKKNCEKYVVLKQGKEKTSAVAKKIRAKIGGELDEIIRVIPAGGAEISE